MGTVLGAALVAVAVGAALGLVFMGVANGGGPLVLLVWVVFSAPIFFGAFKLCQAFFKRTEQLVVQVCDDAIEFRLPGRPVDIVRRSDIEVVVLNEDPFAGIRSFTVYGRGRSVLGVWETDWVVKLGPLVMRTLARHGYPRALKHPLYDRLLWQRPGRQAEGSR